VINTDHSGMAFGLTTDKNIGVSSYNLCYGMSANGTLHNTTTYSAPYSTFNNGDVVGTLINYNTNEINFYKNGTLFCRSNVGPKDLGELYAVVFLYYNNDRISLLTKTRYQMSQLA